MGTIPYTLPISLIFPVSVEIAPASVTGQTFNQGLIIGPSAVIPSVGSNSRIQAFASLDAMLETGFTNAEPEYLAASLYFGQTPTPNVLWVGRQDLTAIAQATAVSGDLGTGYVVGDILTVTQSSASAGKIQVTNVTGGGVIGYESTTATASSGATVLTVASATGIQVGMTAVGVGIPAGTTVLAINGTSVTISQPTTAALSTTAVTFNGVSVYAGGTGYSPANSLATTGGTGTGAQVDVTAVGETPLQAVQYCRLAQTAWYSCMFVGTAADSDYEAIAAYIETTGTAPFSTFFLTSGEASVLNNTANNLFATLQAQKYRRTFMMYSTTQAGAYPNNVYASAAVMGLAMALNTQTPGSYFALAYKELIGVGYEPLTQTQVQNISGTAQRNLVGLNGNLYVNYQNSAYLLLQFGTMAGGTFFDETLNLDMLASNMQTNGIAEFVDLPAIPITDGGVQIIKNAMTQALVLSQQIGFIAPSGTWLGQSIGTGPGSIATGAALPNGYQLYAPPVASLSQTARNARQLPPITAAIIEAESGLSVSVNVVVQS